MNMKTHRKVCQEGEVKFSSLLVTIEAITRIFIFAAKDKILSLSYIVLLPLPDKRA